MFKNNRSLLIIVVFLVSALFVKKFLFQSEEQKVLKRMEELSLLLTKNKGQGVLTVAKKIKQSIDYFQAPLKIDIDYKENFKRIINIDEKQKLKESISSFKFLYGWVIVSFEQTQIKFDGEEVANSSGLVRLNFDSKEQGRVYDLYNIEMGWQKVEGVWLITNVVLSRELPE